MLSQLQANILKYHGRAHAWHVFLTFNEDKKDAVKEWIGQYAWRVTSAKTQLEDAGQHRADPLYDGGSVVCFFLSAEGYTALGFDPKLVGDGLWSMRGSRDMLGDPPVDEWEAVYRQEFHAMILLADNYESKLVRELDIITRQTAGMATVAHLQKGQALRNEDGLSIEHFGYVDGISQPRFLKGEAKPGTSSWNDNSRLWDVLVEESVKGYKDCFGSFLVFRKLEQKVQSFRQKVDALAGMLFPAGTNPNARQLASAYVIGRFQNGTPVVKHAGALDIHTEEKLDNDFDFSSDKQGLKCPFHAHIRVVGPRDIVPGYQLMRIVRRGIPYDEAGRNGDMSRAPEKGVGILFMCYQRDISRYFEKLQGIWANKGEIGDKKTPMDGIIGQGDANTRPQEWPAQWGGPHQTQGFMFSDIVTLLGGEYFFAPSIPFLLQMKRS